METPERAGADDLTHFARLLRQPETYHIFQALRIIEAHNADAPRMGESRRPREDRVRLGQEAELAFPPSTIAGFRAPQGVVPGRLTNRFFGLFGPQGPLPLHVTEYARDRLRNHRDPTIVAFADMLTHRMMTLFYRAWASAQPAPSFDRGRASRFAQKVAALSGHFGPAMQGRDAMPDLATRHFAGHLSLGARHPSGLVAMLAAFIRAPVALQEFVGSWLELEPGDRWRLGSRAGLGQATSVGQRVWSRGAKFRLRIGPMGLAEYRRMLPGGASLSRVDALVRNYAGDALDWDINLVLKAGDVPRAILGQTTSLGHTSWIGQRRSGRDADELFITPGVSRRERAPHLKEGLVA